MYLLTIILLCATLALSMKLSSEENYFLGVLPSILNSAREINVSESVQGNPLPDGMQKPRNVAMKFWRKPHDTYRQTPLSTPLRYGVGETLYVTVELEGDVIDDTAVFLRNCFASTTQGLKSDVIKNGCATTAVDFQRAVGRNGLDGLAQFSLQLSELHSENDAFISCEVSSCKRKCPPECNGRTIRSSGHDARTVHSDSRIVTSGPISPIRRPAKHPIQTSSKSGKTQYDNQMRSIVLPTLIICTNLIILVLLGLFAYSLAKSRAAGRHHIETDPLWCDDMSSRHLFPATKVELVSMVPTSEHSLLVTPSLSDSFRKEAKCQFLKDIEEKNHRIFQADNSEKLCDSSSTTEHDAIDSAPSPSWESNHVVITSAEVTPTVNVQKR